MIKYVYIAEYKPSYNDNNSSLNEYENKKNYYQQVNNQIYETNVDDYIKLLKNNSKNKKYSLLEVIPEDKVNIFFDVDNTPDNIKFIEDLIIKLMNFFGFVKYPIITTYKYKSYHIIFPYYTNLMYLNHLVISFLNIYKEYEYYIDITIYTPYFLFRSIYSYKPSKPNKIRKNKNYHKIIYLKYSKYANLNKDNDIKLSLIQYTNESEYYKPKLIIENYNYNMKNKYGLYINKLYVSYKFLFILSFIINCYFLFSYFMN